MTQEKANEIFEGDLGCQLLSIFSTSDGRCFIRYSESINHGKTISETPVIQEWFPY